MKIRAGLVVGALRVLYNRIGQMDILLSVSLFVAFGAAFVLFNLAIGALARPRVPNVEKSAAYECGEPAIGASWVQFDLRFYIVALVYLIFDVEVALFYPWAVAYGSAGALGEGMHQSAFAIRQVALIDMLVFFAILLVGLAYLWRFGYLDWVRSAATTSLKVTHTPGIDLRQPPQFLANPPPPPSILTRSSPKID